MTTLMETEVLEPLALKEKHTVVLVDDEPPVLAALRRVLRAEPYDVRTTSSPVEALEWIRRGGVSLMVVDQRMPGMCGTELAECVRRMSPRTVRVMLTGYPGNTLVQHGLEEDVQWLIGKPWSDQALRLTIRRLLRDLEATPPPPADPSTGKGEPPVEPRRDGPAAGLLQRALLRAADAVVLGTKWIVGFLWMADAGGKPRV
ncbi:MAG TPA: response regulator [Planctomycetota bacterium]|jgi:CheY-like chemotaxis protein|nr:response regulator [Planctomycetota bacterium]